MEPLQTRQAMTIRVVLPLGRRLTASDLALVSELLRDAAIDREQRLPFDPPFVRRLFYLAATFDNLSADALPPVVA